jgi:acyl-CoA thioesterase
VRTTLWQDDRAHLDMLVTTGRAPDTDPQHQGRPMPAMASPDECRARTQTGATIELADHIDVRIDPATSLSGGEGEPVIRGWMSLRDGTPPDMASLLIAVDVAPPTVAHLGFRGWAPTVELTALLRAEPHKGWLAFEARTTHVQGGWFDEDSAVWDETGRLVAQSRQLALVGPPPRDGATSRA